MARPNPQWRHAEGRRVLVVFAGPHAYVSAAWYESENVVPTWNYAAVHAYGKLLVETDSDRLLEIVRRTVTFYESARQNPWSLDHVDTAFVNGMLQGIVGFTIEIERLEGKWKLNQNHDRPRREKVAGALRGGGSDERQIAELMDAALKEPR